MTSGTTGDETLQQQERPRSRLAPLAPLDWQHQRRSGWRWLRLTLVVGWLVFGTAYAVTVEHPASFGTLEAKVASGDVQQVEVRGDALDEGARGRTTVEVAWRDGLFRHVTTVVEVTPGRPGQALGSERDPTVVSGDVVAQLTEAQPGLDVTRTDLVYKSGWTIFGLPTTSRWRWLALALVLGTFALVVAGPEPWRATRWAWFWLLFLASPVGLVAFLVLGGPPLSPRSHRRLTGGWAFLLALLIGSATGS